MLSLSETVLAMPSVRPAKAPPDLRVGYHASTTLHTFAVSSGASDGANPAAGLISDASGALYGTAQGGGNGNGVVFKLTPPAKLGGAWTETTLYAFTGGADGAHPLAGLLADANGNLYGTAHAGGNGSGVVFVLTRPTLGHASWSESVLHTFNSWPGAADGANPISPLIWCGVNGLYGLCGTAFGGGNGAGVAFELNPVAGVWTETVLHTFNTSPGAVDGANPSAGLVEDASGELYGTTRFGGAGSGVAFKLSPGAAGWSESVLHTFGTSAGAADGSVPAANLLLGPYGTLYGTTTSGGKAGGGVAFMLTPTSLNWSETVMHAFGSRPGFADGAMPVSGLSAAANGTLFGTTEAGGIGYGVLYELSPSAGGWSETIVHTFASSPGAADGANPVAGVLVGAGTGVYGTTEGGGNGYGVLFSY
jgi:hypothetical protein